MKITPELKVSRAITRLAIDDPFYGSVAFRLNVYPNDKINTMRTNGKYIEWSPAFVERITQEEVMGVIKHEILHVVLKHHLRREKRDGKRWNVATDLVINPIVLDDGNELPAGGLLDKRFSKWSAERAYDELPEMPPEPCDWGEVEDLKADDGSDLSEAEMGAAEAEVDEIVMSAADQAKKVGKLPGSIAEIVDEMRESQIDWAAKLRRFVGGNQPDDYTRRRYSKRHYAMFGGFAPSIERHGAGNLVIGWDTSGSFSTRECQHALGEISAVIEETQPESVTIICCDSKVQNVYYYGPGEEIDSVSMSGRGGTKVTPVFDYVEEHHVPCDRLIYFTDMDFWDWPKEVPHYPVMWASTSPNREKDVQFGELLYIKV